MTTRCDRTPREAQLEEETTLCFGCCRRPLISPSLTLATQCMAGAEAYEHVNAATFSSLPNAWQLFLEVLGNSPAEKSPLIFIFMSGDPSPPRKKRRKSYRLTADPELSADTTKKVYTFFDEASLERCGILSHHPPDHPVGHFPILPLLVACRPVRCSCCAPWIAPWGFTPPCSR